MLVGSVDIQGGSAVQLVGGEKLAIDGGDPLKWATRFGRVGEVAIIDLDAAMSVGSNEERIRELCAQVPARVGGGIRSVEAARKWLDAGARKVILGTAARVDILRELPRERVIAAVDGRNGQVVVEGWVKTTEDSIEDRVVRLRDYVGGFLITFVEREGRLGGIDLEQVRKLVHLAGDARVTVAGGVTTPEEVAAIDAMGADCQVGMALYSGRLHEADALSACLTSDRPDGLWPTVVCDTSERALGLCYSNAESLKVALSQGVGAYWSRRRGLWVKGQTSGATQRLISVSTDCDRDTLRFIVEQADPGFCHEKRRSCFGDGAGLGALERRVADRIADAPEGSYTARLLADRALLRAKLIEEAGELADAPNPENAAAELADVLYFALVAAARSGVTLNDAERILDLRALKLTRRPGDAKPQN